MAELQTKILDELKVSVHEQTRTRKAVEVIRDTVKRETSTNPRKELQNRGIAWTREDFRQAIESQDSEAVDLFVDGGMKPAARGIRFVLPGQVDAVAANPVALESALGNDIFTFFTHYDAKVGRALAASSAQLSPDVCMVGDPELTFLDKSVDSGEKLHAYRALCGNASVREALQEGRTKLVKTLASRPDRVQSCERELSKAIKMPPFLDGSYASLDKMITLDELPQRDPKMSLAHVLSADYPVPAPNPLYSYSNASSTGNPLSVKVGPGDPAVVAHVLDRACQEFTDPYFFGSFSPTPATYEKFLHALQ
ncbi:MAG: hypothetical protein ABI216_04085 [Devosia sp.]